MSVFASVNWGFVICVVLCTAVLVGVILGAVVSVITLGDGGRGWWNLLVVPVAIALLVFVILFYQWWTALTLGRL